MRRLVLLTLAVLAACTALSDSSWFTIEGISLPGSAGGTGTITIDLASTTAVTADLHLRNAGTAPGTNAGTGIRGFTVTMDYSFPGSPFHLAGFTQTAVGYLPAPADGKATTAVVGGIALLTADRVAILKDDPSRPGGGGPFTMQVDLAVSGETDEGASVVSRGQVTVTVVVRSKHASEGSSRPPSQGRAA